MKRISNLRMFPKAADRGFGWPTSSPWINFEGVVAHPYSPLGGGGPGRFRVPTSLGTQGNDSYLIPHPQAPVSRYRLLTAEDHAILLADNSPRLPDMGSKDKSQAPATKGPGLELEFFGTFRSVWEGKPDSEVLQAAGKTPPPGKKWFPGTGDLRKFAKSGSKDAVDPMQVRDLRGLLYKLGKNKPETIGRVNLFTHADKGIISLSGEVTWDNVTLYLDRRALDDDAMKDAEEEVFGSEGMTKEQIFAENITIDNVRKAFRKDAVVVIYACHGGLDEPYLKKVDKLFGVKVKVKSFKKMIRYTLVPDKEGKRIINLTFGIEGSPTEVTDFHQLVPDASYPPP